MNIERKSCMKSIEEQFSYLGIIPVVVLEDVKDALPLAKALKDVGLPCAALLPRRLPFRRYAVNIRTCSLVPARSLL